MANVDFVVKLSIFTIITIFSNFNCFNWKARSIYVQSSIVIHIPCPLDVRQIYLLYIGVDIISQVCVDIYNKSADIISVII